jgi:hypothetical protein
MSAARERHGLVPLPAPASRTESGARSFDMGKVSALVKAKLAG